MGKNYANRKSVSERPESDYYSTPKSLVWELLKLDIIGRTDEIYEPANGNGAISTVLTKAGFYDISCDDIRTTGKDFLLCKDHYEYIITNPPFSLFDEFVMQAKKCSDHFIFIAKTNFFGAYQRWQNGIWDNLKHVYIFNRQVDYRSEEREDGLFNVGNLITGWFEWDSTYDKKEWLTSIIDVQKYAKLGQYKENKEG